MRRVALLGALLALVAAIAFARAHADPILRAFTRKTLERELAALLAGEVHIDRIRSLSFGGIAAEGITVLDPKGRKVLHAKSLALGLDLRALPGGIRFSHGLLSDVRIKAIPSEEAAITLFDAFLPRAGDSGGGDEEPFEVSFENVHVARAELTGDVPGLPGIRVNDLDVRADLRVDAGFHARVKSARGRLAAPFATPLSVERAAVRVDSDPFRITAFARAARGEDRLRATLRYTLPERGADTLELLVYLEPSEVALFRELGLPLPETLLGNVRGNVHLAGETSHLRLAAALETDGGPLAVSGDFPDQGTSHVHLESARLSLPEVLAYAPPVELQASVDVTAKEGSPVRIEARAPFIDVLGIETKDADLLGYYDAGRFDVERASVQYAGGEFDVRGFVDENADFSLRVRSLVPDTARDPTLRRAGLSASIRTDLKLEKRGERMSAEGSLNMARLSFRGVDAAGVRVTGAASVEGDFSRPRVSLRGGADRVLVPGLDLGKLALSARGDQGRYASDITIVDPVGRSAKAHVVVAQLENGFHIVASPLELEVQGHEPWRALADVFVDDDGVELRKVELVNGAQRLDMAGRFSFSRAYHVSARLQSFDLGGLRELSGVDLADLDGTIDGELSLTGVPGHPRIDAQGSLRRGQFLGMTDLTVLLSLIFVEGRFDVETEIVLPEGSRIAVYAGGEPGPGSTWGDQIASGNYQFGLDFEDVPFAVGRPWLEWVGVEPPAGRISVTARGAGTFAAPELTLESHIDKLGVGEWPLLDIELRLKHDGQKLDVERVFVADQHGEIGTLAGSIDATFADLARFDELRASLNTRPFDLALQVPPRRLDELPAPIRLDQPWSASGDVRATQSEQGPLVTVSGQLGWPKDSGGIDACGTLRHPTLHVLMNARDGASTLEATAHVDDELLAFAKASAELPLKAWITGELAPTLPKTALDVKATLAATEELPFLCERIAGPLRVTISATDVFETPPELSFSIASKSLQLVPHENQRQRLGALKNTRVMGRPFALDAAGEVSGERVLFTAKIDQGGGARLEAFGAIPRTAFRPSTQAGRKEPAEARLKLHRFELAPIALALPIAARASGVVHGDARITYDIESDALTMEGAVDVSHGKLAIAPLGQELSSISASLRMSGNTLRFADLDARDFSGKVAARGEVVFDTAHHARSTLRLDVERFPVRREGAEVSKLTGTLKLRADITGERTRAELRLDGLRVDLPEELGQELQNLDPNADIEVKGEAKPELPENPYLVELRVVANPPFHMRRIDLAADVSADVTVRYREPVLTLLGSAELKRGNFELYGKRFELIDSRMAFDGAEQLDPLVSLYAVHKVGGDEIGVRVEGRLSNPTVSFTHSNPAITDTGEIIAQLLGARRDNTSQSNQDATGAAASFLAGATAGLLTEEVRRELGGALPVLSIESGNQAFRSARIRAGVQLDQFVEKRLGPLRHVVRGAYVEGFVAPGADPEAVNQSTAPQSRGGGLLELRFPRDLVGSVEYRPVQNWRLDVAWEP